MNDNLSDFSSSNESDEKKFTVGKIFGKSVAA